VVKTGSYGGLVITVDEVPDVAHRQRWHVDQTFAHTVEGTGLRPSTHLAVISPNRNCYRVWQANLEGKRRAKWWVRKVYVRSASITADYADCREWFGYIVVVKHGRIGRVGETVRPHQL
jgi:hypothetical protein